MLSTALRGAVAATATLAVSTAFAGVNLGAITSVKLAFDRQSAGSILLTDLAVSD